MTPVLRDHIREGDMETMKCQEEHSGFLVHQLGANKQTKRAQSDRSAAMFSHASAVWLFAFRSICPQDGSQKLATVGTMRARNRLKLLVWRKCTR